MAINCSRCGKITHKKIGSHWYRESGLKNAYLDNIPVYECSACGISYPSIFRLGRLNDLIALTLVEKPGLLDGNEIRFLRKNLRMPSKLFAGKLGVGKTTLPKWENNVQNHSEGHDRLIRAIYLIEKGISRQNQLRIQKNLERISLKNLNTEYLIIAEKVRDDYVLRYRPVLGGRSEAFPSIGAPGGLEDGIASTGSDLLGFGVVAGAGQTYVHHEPPPVVAEDSLILEGTEPYATQTTEI